MVRNRMRLKTLLLSIAIFLVTAAPALAREAEKNDNGEGLAGETTDKLVTFVGFGVIVFFTVFVIVASWAQGALEKRKEARKTAALRQRIGW
jgi:hypothetical protein